MKPTFWRSASFRFDGGPNERYSSRFFSDTESEEDFIGFIARHARPYVEITIKAPLFCSTSTLKANRTRVERENHSSISSKDGPVNSTVKPPCFDFQASENRNESSSSQEGEIYCAIGTEQKKEQQLTGSPA